MLKKIMGLSVAACVLALISTGAFAQNLVENWSFEDPNIGGDEDAGPGYLDSDEVPGWTRDANNGGVNNNDDISPFLGGGREVPDGEQVYFIQGSDAGSLTQPIDGLEEGEQYMLIFYTGLRPGNTGMNLTVNLGGEEMLAETTISDTGIAPLERFEIPFVYTSDTFGDTPELEFSTIWPDGGDQSINYDAVEIRKPELGAEVTGPGMVAQGDTVVLSTSLSEVVGDATYQWFYDGVELEGETDDTLELLDVVIEDSGTYSVEVTDDAGTATAAYTLVVVEALPVSSTLVLSLLALVLLGAGAFTVRRVYS